MLGMAIFNCACLHNGKKPGSGDVQNILTKHRLIPAGDGLAKNSVNTTPFRQNSLVTHGDTQYIAYFAHAAAGNRSALVLGKRKLGEAKFTTTTTNIMGWTNDAHNSACIMTDGDGYLHLSLIHHNSALEVYRSDEPGSLNMIKITTNPVMAYSRSGGTFTALTTNVYESSTTYTEFYRLPDDPAKGDGDLLFVYREGSSGSGNLVLNRYSRANKRWYRVQDIVVQGNPQSAYWQVYLDDNGRLHLSWVFRGSADVRTNHDMYYAYSDDQGVTWKKIDGTQYTLPITSATAERVWEIAQDQNLMNQTSMTADKDSHPYIATYWGRPTMQYRVIYHDGTTWKMSTVSERTTLDDGGISLFDGSRNPSPYLSGGGTKLVPIARPRMIAKYDTATGKTKAYYIFRDNWERGGKVSMYSTEDITSNVWTLSDLTDFDVKYWEPSYDTELWKNQGKLHVFVQYADYLSDGSDLSFSKVTAMPVYCLEVDLDS